MKALTVVSPLLFLGSFSGAPVIPSDAFAGDSRSEDEYPGTCPQSLTAACRCNLLLGMLCGTESSAASVKGLTSDGGVWGAAQDSHRARYVSQEQPEALSCCDCLCCDSLSSRVAGCPTPDGSAVAGGTVLLAWLQGSDTAPAVPVTRAETLCSFLNAASRTARFIGENWHRHTHSLSYGSTT